VERIYESSARGAPTDRIAGPWLDWRPFPTFGSNWQIYGSRRWAEARRRRPGSFISSGKKFLNNDRALSSMIAKKIFRSPTGRRRTSLAFAACTNHLNVRVRTWWSGVKELGGNGFPRLKRAMDGLRSISRSSGGSIEKGKINRFLPPKRDWRSGSGFTDRQESSRLAFVANRKPSL